MVNLVAAIGYIIAFLTGGGTVIVGLYYFQEFIAKSITRIKYLLSFIWGRYERSYIKSDIETTINFYDEENLGLEVPYGIDVNWQDEYDAHLNDEDVVLFLDAKEGQPQNLARATLQYTNKGVLPEARPCLDQDINNGLDYCLSIDILDKARQEDARLVLRDELADLLRNHDHHPDISENFQRIYKEMDWARRDGTIGSVLLREYEQLKGINAPTDGIFDETKRFLSFVARHAVRGNTEEIDGDIPDKYIDVDWDFEDPTYFEATIAYISGGSRQSIQDYVENTRQSLADGRRVYLLAGGHQIKRAKEVQEAVEDLELCREANGVEYELSRDTFKPYHKNYCVQIRPVRNIE